MHYKKRIIITCDREGTVGWAVDVATEGAIDGEATIDAGVGDDVVPQEEGVGVGEVTDDVGGCCFFFRASL